MTEIVIVVAVARNGVIGAKGGLPWRLRSDLRRFRQLTMGKPVVMGRKTFESIGKPLDGRDNIVVTRQSGSAPDGVLIAGDIETALALASKAAERRGASEICVIGGAALFAAALPLATRLHVTHVEVEPEGDVRFPDIDRSEWTEESREALPASEGDTAAAVLVTYRRRSP